MTKERTHFVRFLRKAEIEAVLDQFKGLETTRTGSINDMLEVKAPDGTVVFASMKKSANQDAYICRFHKEIFDQEVDTSS
jgi:hypothetical protein